MEEVITVRTLLYTIDCCACGIAFGVPRSLIIALKNSHKDFFCPNGHAQAYKLESEAEKLRRQLTQAIERENNLSDENRKLKQRISKGICPCCNRSFQNLKRHMSAKHPGFR